MSTTGESTDHQNKTCRNIIIGFCIVGCIGFIIIISLFIWHFGFRYKDKGPLTPVECQQANGVNYQDFCYVPSSSELSWEKAEKECVKQSGHLASIPSDEVNTGATSDVFKLWPNSTDAWIGLNDMGDVSKYQYSDGSNVTYTNWASSVLALTPAESDARRCVSISAGLTKAADNATAGQWVKHDCETAYAYICRFALATAPHPPTGVMATPKEAAAEIKFDAPANNGGKPVDNYTVTSWPDWINVTGTKSPITVSGLRPYIQYNFTVVATNVVGSSAPSDPATFVVALPTKPDPPTNVVAKPGDGSIVVSFTPPVSDGGANLTSFEITIQPPPAGGGSVSIPVNQIIGNTLTVPGLTNGQSTTLTVAAKNSDGKVSSPVTTNPVTPLVSIPNTPTGFTATPAFRSVNLSWNAAAGGAAPTSYNVTVYHWVGESLEWLPTVVFPTGTCPCDVTVPNLMIGKTYYFYVIAVGTDGSSAPTPEESAIPFALPPFPPQNVVATAGGRAAQVTFFANEEDGGFPVLSFTVTSNDTSVPNVTFVVTEEQNSTIPYNVTVPALTPGNRYKFAVSALNDIGQGDWSAFSAPVTIQTGFPDPPVNVTAKPTGRGALVSWNVSTAPNSDGGSPITNFTIIANPGGLRVTSVTAMTDVVVSILMVDVNYTFNVIATNANGPSQPSQASNIAVPYAVVPDAPTAVVAMAGPQLANVTWMAPDNGGMMITSYEVTSNLPNPPIVVNITVNDSSPLFAIVPHLWDVTPNYTFVVAAANVAGRGPNSAPSSPIKVNATRPDPPVNVKVKASISGADVSFTAPLNTGGVKIDSYYAISDPFTDKVPGGESPLSFKNLDSKMNYTFVVYAINAYGTSDPSLPSESFQRSAQLLKDLAIPIAGGIILGLLLIVGIIIGVFYCKNNEKCCWARDGGSTTADKPVAAATTSVDLEEAPKTEPIALGMSSSGYDITQEKAADQTSTDAV